MATIFGRLELILANKPFAILDGAMGTELERRGYRTTLPLWSAPANQEAPGMVRQIHEDYIRAGSDILTANTFRTTEYTLAKAGKGEFAEELTQNAVNLAIEAAAGVHRDVLVAGSLAPMEDCYSPELVPESEVIRNAYMKQVSTLARAGVDLVLVETMINREEIRIASQCCRTFAMPYMMSCVVEDGKILDGTTLEHVISDLDDRLLLAVLLNCRTPDRLTAGLPLLRQHYPGIIGAYANGPGQPDPDQGWKLASGGIEDYVGAAIAWYHSGAKIIGGCCGTTPAHIQALSEMEIGT